MKIEPKMWKKKDLVLGSLGMRTMLEEEQNETQIKRKEKKKIEEYCAIFKYVLTSPYVLLPAICRSLSGLILLSFLGKILNFLIFLFQVHLCKKKKKIEIYFCGDQLPLEYCLG